MNDFDRLQARFQALARALDAEVTARERFAAGARHSALTAEELRAEIELHEEALRVATERRRALGARRELASGPNAPTDRERLDVLLAEIDREVPQLEQSLRALRERLGSGRE